MNVQLPRIEKILFATDFSVFSERARAFALTLALKFRAAVVVLHVMEALGLDAEQDDQLSEWISSLEARMKQQMESEIDQFHRLDLAAEGEILWGIPWREINRLAEERADLVVIGSHGLSKDMPLLGTTSHKVAMTCRKPVLIIRDSH